MELETKHMNSCGRHRHHRKLKLPVIFNSEIESKSETAMEAISPEKIPWNVKAGYIIHKHKLISI